MILCYRLSSHPWPNRWHQEAWSLYLQVGLGTLKPMKRMQQCPRNLQAQRASSEGVMPPQGTPGSVWRHFWLSQLMALPTSSMLLPGKLLPILQHRG